MFPAIYLVKNSMLELIENDRSNKGNHFCYNIELRGRRNETESRGCTYILVFGGGY